MDELMTEQVAAKYLGVHKGTLSNWRSTKKVEIPYVKIGKAVRYKKSDLDFFIEKCIVLPKGR